MAVYTMPTSYNSLADMMDNEHIDHEGEQAPRSKTSALTSRASKEDARVLLQISYLLDKKKQQKNNKNSNYQSKQEIDREQPDYDSDLLTFQSTSCSTISHSTSYLHEPVSISSDSQYSIQSPDDIVHTGSDNVLLPHQGPPRNKTEERALKRIRRKIKNKLSAQESRRKKKEYLENLEKTVVSCTSENSILKEQVSSLNNTVRQLLRELKRVQESKHATRDKGTQTGICLKCHLHKVSKENTSQDQS